jgi:hypothetical protein
MSDGRGHDDVPEPAASQIEHALVFHAARWWYLASMRRWRQ